ncbi:MAG: GH92 family glycosyl hydrolase [Planctomycetota bacterium]
MQHPHYPTSQQVEPRLGTRHTRWIHFTSAARPFPMLSLSPDTRVDGDWGCGYSLHDDSFVGISHVHDWQLAGLLVMPVRGHVDASVDRNGLRSPFDRSAEHCKPGDHRFVLQRDGTSVELTATLRTGWHRYRFVGEGPRSIVLDLAGPLGPCEMADASLCALGPRRFEASVTNLPTRRRSQPVRLYFAIELDTDTVLQEARGGAVRAQLTLPDETDTVVMRVALSYTSMEGAWRNMQAEAETFGFDFDAVRDDAIAEWGRWLSRVDASTVDADYRPRFATDLFFALAGRRTCSDADGAWLDSQGETPVVRHIPIDPATGQPGYRHFNSDALWGAQWSIIPLWLDHYPDVIRDFCESFYDYARHGGYIPRGPSGGRDTFVMTSAQATPLFAAAILRGVWQPDDPHALFEHLKANHLPGGAMSKCGYEHDTCLGGGIEDYLELGYIPEDRPESGFHCNGCAQTLEHSYNDHALALLAKHLGRNDDAAEFTRRSKLWRNLFDPAIGFVRPRLRNGDWLEPYDPMGKPGMTEANGWNYTFYAAHDLDGLAECFGSTEALIDKLEQAMQLSGDDGFFAPHGDHEVITLDFGNEPALATPWLFAALGRPDRMTHWLRRIMAELKSGNAITDWHGGDEDQGMMGAWSVLAALGRFSLDGGCSPIRLPVSPLAGPSPA